MKISHFLGTTCRADLHVPDMTALTVFQRLFRDFEVCFVSILCIIIFALCILVIDLPEFQQKEIKKTCFIEIATNHMLQLCDHRYSTHHRQKRVADAESRLRRKVLIRDEADPDLTAFGRVTGR